MLRRNRQLKGLVGVGAVLLAVAMVAGFLADRGRLQAIAAEDRAAIEALVGDSLVTSESDRGLAALLAVEAHRRAPGPTSASALLGVFTADPGFMGDLHLPGIYLTAELIPGTSTAFVQHGRELLSVVDLETGERDLRFGDRVFQDQRLRVAVSGDGSRAAVTEYAPRCVFEPLVPDCVTLRVYDLASGEITLGPVTTPIAVSDVALNHDGSLVAIGTAEDGAIAWYRTSDGARTDLPGLLGPDEIEPWERFTRYDQGSVLFASDGTLFATDRGGNVRAIDPAEPATARVVRVPAGHAQRQLVQAGGTVVMTGHRGIAAVDAATLAVLWSHSTEEDPHPDTCGSMDASAFTGRVYCGTHAGIVDLRDLETGERTTETIAVQHGQVGDVKVSADGRELVVLGGQNPILSRWRLDGSGLVTRLTAPGRALGEGWGYGGEALVVTDRPTTSGVEVDPASFELWDTEEDRAVRSFDGLYGLGWVGPHTVVGWSDAEERLEFHDLDGTMRPAPAELEGVENLLPTPGGTRMWTFSPNGPLVPVDLESLLPGDPVIGEELWWVAFVSESADGSVVAVRGATPENDAVVATFSGETGQPIASAPEDQVWVMAVTNDGALYGTETGRITQYDPATFERLGSFPAATGEIWSLQFSADDRLMLAGGVDQTVTLFDVATRTRIGSIPTDAVRTSSSSIMPNGFLHPDGSQIAVTVTQGVQVWDLDVERWAEAACRVAGRNLSEAEWENYLSDFGPYRETCPEG